MILKRIVFIVRNLKMLDNKKRGLITLLCCLGIAKYTAVINK